MTFSCSGVLTSLAVFQASIAAEDAFLAIKAAQSKSEPEPDTTLGKVLRLSLDLTRYSKDLLYGFLSGGGAGGGGGGGGGSPTASDGSFTRIAACRPSTFAGLVQAVPETSEGE